MIPHQANIRIIKCRCRQVGIAPEKVVIRHRPNRQHNRRDHSAGHAKDAHFRGALKKRPIWPCSRR